MGVLWPGDGMPPAWRPCDFVEDPRAFGRPNAEPTWIRDGTQDGRLAAAYFQHRVARAAYVELGPGRRYDLDTLAEQLGESRDYVRRKLHGQIPMAFDDLMRLVELLGVQILPPLDPSNFEDLLP